MDMHTLMTTAIEPALKLLAKFGVKSDERAEHLLLAIAKQESGLVTRWQTGGPAHGFWQFEIGGIRGVYNHPVSGPILRNVCKSLVIPFDIIAIYNALPHNDVLAACVARLLLLTDPKPLPADDQAEAAWDYYERNWRPGKPHEASWAANWELGSEAVMVASAQQSADKDMHA